MLSLTKALLRFEAKARKFFERVPFIQAFLAGIGVIIFWRGVWELLDANHVSPVTSIILGGAILFVVGSFIQTFLGNSIIIKEVQQEEQLEKRGIKRLQKEEQVEEVSLAQLSKKIDALSKKIEQK